MIQVGLLSVAVTPSLTSCFLTCSAGGGMCGLATPRCCNACPHTQAGVEQGQRPEAGVPGVCVPRARSRRRPGRALT